MIDDLLMCLRGRTVTPSEADELIAAIRDRTVWPRTWGGTEWIEEEDAKLVKRMRACGKRLHDINVAARAKVDEERLERWKAKGRKVVRI